MWGAMRMDPTDLADVSRLRLHLSDERRHAGRATGPGCSRRGERVRLRFINGSSMSFFDVRIPGLKLTVVAADGQDVEPVTVDELRIGAAEVYDVIVEPQDDRAYTIFAQSMDRSGYARGTLAPRAGMTAAVPALDARALLTMSDMGMAHAATGMDHSSDGSRAPCRRCVTAARRSSGPTSTCAPTCRARSLDDPGIGLRDNGRRVLTYADLHTIGGPDRPARAGREIELHLTGHMERYIWSFDGQKFSDAQPLRFTHGERLRIVLVNDTMMTHPIHLHGMWSELEDAHGEFLVRKHTVTVQPAQRLALSRHRRRARSLGVSLPPALSHGSGHVPRSGGGVRRAAFAQSLLRRRCAGRRARASEHVPPDPPQTHVHDMPYDEMVEMMGMDDRAPFGKVMLDRLEWRDADSVRPMSGKPRPGTAVTSTRCGSQTEGEHVDGSAGDARVEVALGPDPHRLVEHARRRARGFRRGPDARLVSVRRRRARAGILRTGSDGISSATAGARRCACRRDYDLLLTQRLVLQPEARAELLWQATIPSGSSARDLSDLELGLRLRYEIRREFAPYLGVSWSKRFGDSADLAQAAGVDSDEVAWVAGIRAWF